MSAFDLGGEGKVAFITGAASGLGRATADVFGEAGYRLLLADVDTAGGQAAADELSARSVPVQFVTTDVSDSESVKAAIARATDTWDRLDVVMNNAAIGGKGSPIEELSEADVDAVLAVDLKGPMYVCKHAIRAQRPRNGGVIVNVTSISAERGSPFYPAYSAAKAGLIGLTRSLARQVGRFNIRLNCLSPGSMAGTNLLRASRGRELTRDERQQEAVAVLKHIPLGRPASPRDVAVVALFLASPLARHIHGAVVTVDGGELLGV
jgi:NAD(P)-dependent dehydrogenase (short-subunit alcohol dehydrogenase family)